MSALFPDGWAASAVAHTGGASVVSEDDYDDHSSHNARTDTGISWSTLKRAMRWETFALLAVIVVLTFLSA